jgi:cleavage and polyadenylation specificity factor subunit 1
MYCLNTVDRFTRWPEAIPIPDRTADTVARALLTGWISSFGCPKTITTDQGHQFESQLFHSLAKLCGFHLTRTTAYHPAANGLVERFHRTLKAAIMCHADQHWTEALPLVLLAIRTSFKADQQGSLVELVYGEPLRMPGKLLTQTAHPVEPAHLITQLYRHMACLRPVPATRQTSPGRFVHKDLHNGIRLPPSGHNAPGSGAPYSGPYQVLFRKEKTLQLLVCGKPITISTERVKPAYIFNEAVSRPVCNPGVNTLPDSVPPATPPAKSSPPTDIRTTRSGRYVHFPVRFSN